MSLPSVSDYSLLEKIGSGSYATVYKAFKKDGCREVVAIKCVDKSSLSKSAIDNLVTEINLLKILHHEHIVEMRDFFWDEGHIYIVMEYCDDGDLSSFIRKRRKLPEQICRRFLQQLALALKYLRDHNISHMDLKPENLLLTKRPQLTLKVGDFGFAQYLSNSEHKFAIRGSPLYMAPEILLKQKYDARVDLWSVGVIMYECLFGKAPYSSSSFQELAEKIKETRPIEVTIALISFIQRVRRKVAARRSAILRPQTRAKAKREAISSTVFLCLLYRLRAKGERLMVVEEKDELGVLGGPKNKNRGSYLQLM